MSDSSEQASVSFSCQFCHEDIYIPPGLPPTTAPCPHCGKEVTSPDFSKASVGEMASQQVPPVQERPNVHDLLDSESREVPTISGNKRRGQEARLIWIGAIVILLVAGGVAFWLANQWKINSSRGPAAKNKVILTPEQAQQEWMMKGWMAEASKVLSGFMKAKSPEERMKYVIPNPGVREELEMFYPAGNDDSDTPFESFAHRSGNLKDHERGIFLMQYRQPAQIDIRDFFSPIGSLDRILGMKEPSLIEVAHQISEDNLSKPIGINAFFKRTDEGLKLDSSVFIQSKFRTFRAFIDYPRPGVKKVFRVVISETIDHDLRDDKRYRSYRLDDFAYPKDHVNLPVKVDSELGKTMEVLNWRGMNREVPMRTATVVMGWSNEQPSKLQLEQVICWQFLGVGGEIGNTRPVATPPPASQSPAPPIP